MHVFIITATTADGFIAKDENHVAMWTSKEDKRRFVELTKRAGVIVMGSRTFRTLPKPLKDRVNIVYSRNQKFEGAEVTNIEPSALIAALEKRGFKEVAICGGSQIYTAFMKTGLVTTVYMTVEPIVFGKGISIFNEPIEYKLDLVSHSANPSGSLFLEYKVIA